MTQSDGMATLQYTLKALTRESLHNFNSLFGLWWSTHCESLLKNLQLKAVQSRMITTKRVCSAGVHAYFPECMCSNRSYTQFLIMSM